MSRDDELTRGVVRSVSRIGAEQMQTGRCTQRAGPDESLGLVGTEHGGGGETTRRVSLGMSLPVDVRGGEVGGSARLDYFARCVWWLGRGRRDLLGIGWIKGK